MHGLQIGSLSHVYYQEESMGSKELASEDRDGVRKDESPKRSLASSLYIFPKR